MNRVRSYPKELVPILKCCASDTPAAARGQWSRSKAGQRANTTALYTQRAAFAMLCYRDMRLSSPHGRRHHLHAWAWTVRSITVLPTPRAAAVPAEPRSNTGLGTSSRTRRHALGRQRTMGMWIGVGVWGIIHRRRNVVSK